MKNKWLGLVTVMIAVFAFSACAQKQKSVAQKSTAGLKRIHFDFDKSAIRPDAEKVLRKNANWMSSHSESNVTVAGHCDERGSYEYNIALGDRRAQTAKVYLRQLGVSSSRMKTVSYGEESPISNCHDESCWWQNRRAEFVAR